MNKTLEKQNEVCYIEKMINRVSCCYTEEEAEKFRQMILYAIKCGATDKGIYKTKLAKEIYLADFIWFYENNYAMSDMIYIKRERGPVADAFFRIIEELEESGAVLCERKQLVPDNIDKISMSYSLSNNVNIKYDKLSEQEKELIEQIGAAWKDRSAKDIINFTHRQLPYIICRDEEVIPYSLITQEEVRKIYGPIKLLRRI
jgi:hypothetical protein